MERASRNRVLMVGGALIVIALLLVCGPLKGRFGQGGEDQPPAVAAGPPPADIAGTVGMAAAGAAAGAAIGESDLNAAIADEAERDVAAAGAMAAAAAAAAASAAAVVDVAASDAGAASATQADAATPSKPADVDVAAAGASQAIAESAAVASGAAGSSSSMLPPIAAGVPITTLAAAQASAAPPAPAATPAKAVAERAFDSALLASGAGKVVGRFAPPVASGRAVSSLSLAAAQSFDLGRVLRACDSPGASCSNSVTPLQAVNPPFSTRPKPGPQSQF